MKTSLQFGLAHVFCFIERPFVWPETLFLWPIRDGQVAAQQAVFVESQKVVHFPPFATPPKKNFPLPSPNTTGEENRAKKALFKRSWEEKQEKRGKNIVALSNRGKFEMAIIEEFQVSGDNFLLS